MLVELAGGGFNFDEATEYVENLSDRMRKENPAGLQVIIQELDGTPLSKLQDAVLGVLHAFNPSGSGGTEKQIERVLSFNPGAGDQAMVAALKDIVEAMMQATGRILKIWDDEKTSTNRRSSARSRSCNSESGAGALVVDVVEVGAHSNTAVRSPSVARSVDPPLLDAWSRRAQAAPAAASSAAPAYTAPIEIRRAASMASMRSSFGTSNAAAPEEIVTYLIYDPSQVSNTRVLRAELGRRLNRKVHAAAGSTVPLRRRARCNRCGYHVCLR